MVDLNDGVFECGGGLTSTFSTYTRKDKPHRVRRGPQLKTLDDLNESRYKKLSSKEPIILRHRG